MRLVGWLVALRRRVVGECSFCQKTVLMPKMEQRLCKICELLAREGLLLPGQLERRRARRRS